MKQDDSERLSKETIFIFFLTSTEKENKWRQREREKKQRLGKVIRFLATGVLISLPVIQLQKSLWEEWMRNYLVNLA